MNIDTGFYRELEPHEATVAGDQYRRFDGDVWSELQINIGRRVSEYAGSPKFRRPIPQPEQPTLDLVNEPPHYKQHPSGVECIQVTEGMNFCLGNAVKYIWRADLKGEAIQDLEKAKWYLDREIERRKKQMEVKP